MIASIAAGAVSFLLKLGFGGIVDKALSHLEARADNETERERIRAQTTVEAVRAEVDRIRAEQKTARHLASEGTARQQAKFSHPIFWVLVTAALGPGVLNLWMLWLYNFLWWSGGIFPQRWSIAAYPPQAAVWVDMSIRWLFDPVAMPVTIATAAAAALAAGRKRR